MASISRQGWPFISLYTLDGGELAFACASNPTSAPGRRGVLSRSFPEGGSRCFVENLRA